MQIVCHAGAHATDEDHLLKCLLRNAALLRGVHTAVPGPSRYRNLLRDAVNAMDHAPAAPDSRHVLIDAILDQDAAGVERMVLSNPHFFAVPKIAVRGGRLYPQAGTRMQYLQELFHGDEVHLFLALRNPATFLPALWEMAPEEARAGGLAGLLDGADPRDLRWSELIARIRAEVPDLPMTIWCDEDTPLIWGEVVRRAGGLALDQKIQGAFDVLARVMTEAGMRRFRAYLKDHPGLPEMQKRKVMAAFWARYPREEAIVEECALPGWDAALIEELTQAYDEDVEAIAALPGVRVILP